MPNEGSFEAPLRRSDQIKRDLLVHPEDYTMFTGDRPTGTFAPYDTFPAHQNGLPLVRRLSPVKTKHPKLN